MYVSKKSFTPISKSPLSQRAFLHFKGKKMAELTQLKAFKSQESIVSGITEFSDLQKAYEAGATYAGFIFVLTSPYGIAIDKAKEIAEQSPMKLLGIFQNSDIADILYVAQEINLSAVLLNGWETQEFITELRRHLPDTIRIIKIAHLSDAAPKMNYQHVDFYLLGGHLGEALEPNWQLLETMDLSNVFVSSNWKDRALLPNLSLSPLGIEMNFKM